MDKQPILYLNKEDNYLYLFPETAKQIGREDSIPYYFHDEKDKMVFAPYQNYSSLYHYCSINTMMNANSGSSAAKQTDKALLAVVNPARKHKQTTTHEKQKLKSFCI